MLQIPDSLKTILKPDAPLYRPHMPVGQRCTWAHRWVIPHPNNPHRPLTVTPSDFGLLEEMTQTELIQELEDIMGRGRRIDDAFQLIHAPIKTASWKREVYRLLRDEREHYREIPIFDEGSFRYSLEEQQP